MKNKLKLSILTSIIGVILYKLYKPVKFLFGPKGGNEGAIAETEPSFTWYDVSQRASYFLFKIYNSFKLFGREHIPTGTQFVTVANHASILDGFIMGGSVGLPLFIMVKKEAFDNPIKGFYLRKVMCFPVDRSIVDTKAIRTAMKVINDGNNLGLFPEGTRNREGYVGEFKPGAIKFALRKKLPILPAYIANAHELTPVNKVLPRPAKLSVHFLPLISTEELLAQGKTEEDILEMLHELICNKGTEVMGYDVRANKK